MLSTNEIKSRLILRGIKIVDVARTAGVSPTTVSIVLSRKGKSKRIQKALARAIETSYKEVWNNDIKAA